MAQNQSLQTGSLSPSSEPDSANPTRGQMRMNLLGRLRPPPFVHQWEFWHDRQDRETSKQEQKSPTLEQDSANPYESRLRHLASISDVRSFWELFNNFPLSSLPLRDTVHLFKYGVKPVWEDPRNERGGQWTFRVPTAVAGEFWKDICLMAVGEKLQEAVSSARTEFKDDICGVSLSVRTTSCLITIWNRDGEHQEGIDRILEVVRGELSEGLLSALRDRNFYYKKHSEHAGFSKPSETPSS